MMKKSNVNFFNEIELIEKENVILNSFIKSISLYNDPNFDYLSAQLCLNPQTINFQGEVQFTFFNIKTFYWYNKDDVSLGYIERYKLLKLGDGVYFSLDPFDEQSLVPSEKDNSVIWADKLERSYVF